MITNIKKILILFLSGLMLLSTLTVSAGYVTAPWGEGIPETGVLLCDDFESYTGDRVNLKRKGEDGPWNNNGTGSLITYNGNKVISNIRHGQSPNLANFLYFCPHEIYGGTGTKEAEISTGRVLYEYDVYIPESDFTYTDYSTQQSAWYFVTYTYEGIVNSNAKKRAYISRVHQDFEGKGPALWFQTETVHEGQGYSASTPIMLEKEKWYTVSTVVDYDSGLVKHYLNGKLKVTDDAGAEIKEKYALYEPGWSNSNKNIPTGEQLPEIYTDNIRIERLAPEVKPVQATVSAISSKELELVFSDVVNVEFYTDESFLLAESGTEKYFRPSEVTPVNGRTLHLTLKDDLKTNKIYYLLAFDNPFPAYTGNTGLADGTALFFASKPASQEDFGLSNVSFYNYNDNYIDIEQNSVSAGMKTVVLEFNREVNGNTVDTGITVSGNPVCSKTISGKQVTIDFTNCLAPNRNYTITLDSNLKDINGKALCSQYTFSFTTDKGKLVSTPPTIEKDGKAIYLTSNISYGQSLTGKTTVYNTTGQPANVGLFIVGYQQGKLSTIQSKGAIARRYKTNISVEFTVDEKLVESDKIKLFVFDGTNLRPLSDATELTHTDIAQATLDGIRAKMSYMEAVTPLGGEANCVTHKGVTGWELNPAVEEESYLRIRLDDDFLYDMKNETVTVTVDYYDNSLGDSGFALLYDGVDGKLKYQFVMLSGGNVWKTVEIPLYDAAFKNGIFGDDIRIITNDTEYAEKTQWDMEGKGIMGVAFDPVTIGAVSIKKEPTISPYTITVTTEKFGNVFVEGEPITFAVDFAEYEGSYPSGTVTYTVRDVNQEVVEVITHEYTNNSDTVTIPTPKFGVYYLTVEVEHGGIYQSKLVDFSYVRKGNTNVHSGTLVHFNMTTYDEKDVKGIIDLVKNAGFGFVRNGVNWNDIEPNADGNYFFDDEIFYANKYLHEQGLESLVVLGQQNWKMGQNHGHFPEGDGRNNYYWLLEEAERQKFADACYYAVDQLKEYTDYFSIGNEFNLQTPDRDNPRNAEAYLDIVKAAVPAIREANPKAKVTAGVVGSWDESPTGRNGWMRELLSKGMMDYADIFDYHAYDIWADPENPTTGVGIFKKFYYLLREYEQETPGWITENGWATRHPDQPRGASHWACSVHEQTTRYPRAIALYTNSDFCDKYFTYCFVNNRVGYYDFEHNLGIIHSEDYRTPFAVKPAYVTVAALNHFVGDATFVKNHSYSTYAAVYEYNKGGKSIYMLCTSKYDNSEPTYTVNIEGATSLQVYDMYGNLTEIVPNGTTFTITQEPAYIMAV